MADVLNEQVASILRDIVVVRVPYSDYSEPPRYAVYDRRGGATQKVSLSGKHGPTVERKIALQTALIIKLFKGTPL